MSGLESILAFACVLMIASAVATGEAIQTKTYPRRYEGVRWQIVYSKYSGVERFAVDELQRAVQLRFPYVVSIAGEKQVTAKDAENLILVGTPKNHPLIKELIQAGKLSLPKGSQGFSIAALDSPWKKDQRVIALAGNSPEGVLYGVEEFAAHVAPSDRAGFDQIADLQRQESPAIENRGIWTWGYAIYDYHRFFDHMARLKMNTLIVWNDCVPENGREMIDFAHSRGIKVIMGFHWGWGIDNLDPNSASQRKQLKKEVVENFRKNYLHLGVDGIYFQTFTEHNNLALKGRSTAALACEWVNDIASGILKIAPKMRIEFGLHATSIREKYTDLKTLDPRVTITWEDGGELPFAYDPVVPNPVSALDDTIAYAKKLATFRSNREFSMVAKGWINLDWGSEFEHHGPFIVGERDRAFITERLVKRQPIWDRMNALWAENYPHAARFYREVLGAKPTRCSVTALVEDGMFEELIQPSLALFGETLWNPYRDDQALKDRAASAYYLRP